VAVDANAQAETLQMTVPVQGALHRHPALGRGDPATQAFVAVNELGFKREESASQPGRGQGSPDHLAPAGEPGSEHGRDATMRRGPMNARRLLLLSLLLVAAWLALFGDKTPQRQAAGEVVAAAGTGKGGSAAERAQSAPARREPAGGCRPVSPASGAKLEVAALIPREQLIPAAWR
jgi:hypothetical protein